MSLRRTLAITALVAGCIGCDQETKRLAVQSLRYANPIELCAGSVRLLYAENTGAWGSLGANWFGPLKTLAFVIAPGLLLLGWFVHLLRTQDRRWSFAIAGALVIGGGLGNLIDRVRAGYVVDFIYIGVGRIGTNVFNVADVAVVAGVLLLLVSSRSKRPAGALPA